MQPSVVLCAVCPPYVNENRWWRDHMCTNNATRICTRSWRRPIPGERFACIYENNEIILNYSVNSAGCHSSMTDCSSEYSCAVIWSNGFAQSWPIFCRRRKTRTRKWQTDASANFQERNFISRNVINTQTKQCGRDSIVTSFTTFSLIFRQQIRHSFYTANANISLGQA